MSASKALNSDVSKRRVFDASKEIFSVLHFISGSMVHCVVTCVVLALNVQPSNMFWEKKMHAVLTV